MPRQLEFHRNTNIINSLQKSGVQVGFDFVGLAQFQRLFATERFVASGWHILLFGVLFIAVHWCSVHVLAVFIDQHVRFQGAFRMIFFLT